MKAKPPMQAAKRLRQRRIESGLPPEPTAAEIAKAKAELRAFIGHEPWVMERSQDVKDKAPPQYASTEAKRGSLIKAALELRRVIGELQANAAAGDELAMKMLVTFLLEAVDWLGGVSHRQPELVRQIARQRFHWPMLWAQHSQVVKDCRGYAKRIQLKEGEPPYSKGEWGKGWGGKWSTATLWAIGIRATIEANKVQVHLARLLSQQADLKTEWKAIPQWAKDCLKLRPLTKDTAPKWFEVGWLAILEHTKGHPEDVPELRALGEHRAGKYARRYVKAQAGRTRAEILHRKESPKATAAADARSRIKERIAQALQSLAPSR